MASTDKPYPVVMVLGSGGQLGQEFKYLHAHGSWRWQPCFFDHRQADLEHPGQISSLIREYKPAIIINAAAYTAVDRAESEPDQAMRINGLGPSRLAEVCANEDIFLIHFSTDYVYHNGLTRPLREDDPVHPQSVYARTKLSGEQAVRVIQPESMVLRTSWVYSRYGQNFVKTMLRLGREKSEIRVVDDQMGSPTWARDLAGAVLRIINDHGGDLRPFAGVYNYSNEGECSWYVFAKEIFREAGLTVRVLAIPTTDYPTPAIRPPYSVLDKTKFKATFRLTIPAWQDSLKACLPELLHA